MHAFSARDSPASWCSAGAGSSSWDAGARCENASMLGSASCPHTCATASRCSALRFGSLEESSTAAAAASRKLLNPSCFSASFSAGSPPAPPSAHTRHVPYSPSVLQGGAWQVHARSRPAQIKLWAQQPAGKCWRVLLRAYSRQLPHLCR